MAQNFAAVCYVFGVPVESTTPDALHGALERAFAHEGPAVIHLPALLEMWSPTP